MKLLEIAIPYLISLCAVLATFYGVRHTNRVNMALQRERLLSDERNQDRAVIRAKGEELYMLLRDFRTDLGKTIETISNALLNDGKNKAIEVANLRISNNSSLRIEMLTEVYFPKEVNELEKVKSHHGKILAEMLKIIKVDTDEQSKTLIMQLISMASEMTTLTYRFQKALISDLQTMGAGFQEPTRRA